MYSRIHQFGRRFSERKKKTKNKTVNLIKMNIVLRSYVDHQVNDLFELIEIYTCQTHEEGILFKY